MAKKNKEISNIELQSLLSNQIQNALGYLGGQLSDSRTKSLEYYLGDKLGTEIDGRSQVVSTDVSDTIESLLPNLLRVFTESDKVDDFKDLIKKNTKILYIETPSNPLLGITVMKEISSLAKENGILTMIDNTFASPINQNPIDFGIDIMLHSATKYMGGHSDISAGAIAASKEHIEQIWKTAINFGGNLSDQTVWLLERSLKTLNLRVKEQTKNALEMAEYLENNSNIDNVYYPGLKSHPQYELAKKQMKGFGAMLSFELSKGIDAMEFQNNLQLIKPSMSLAGLESTTVSST